MKRTTLLIAIAAIAAVGIAVGIVASGAGPGGSLQGRLEPVPTTLTLEYGYTILGVPGGYTVTLHGTLVDATGAPVVNRPVTLWCRNPGETAGHNTGTATSGADGAYAFPPYFVFYGDDRLLVYFTEFAGDDLLLASRSPDVSGP